MKRIVVCCDGTWNKPGSTDRGQRVETNVERIYKAVDTESVPGLQIKFYGPGVGTKFAITDQLLGGGTGMGIDKNIQDAYKFIMWSYQPGDELYLFGFSRGAYTIRSLGGLIRNCGVLRPEYLNLVSEAYQLYRDRTILTHPDSDQMQSFRKTYSMEVQTPIKFMGVWDTVGALGIPLPWFNWWNRKYQFHDVKLSGYVKFAYQALAIDERRRIFAPSLWELNHDEQEEKTKQVCEQVWFPGVHGNVGGGYVDCGLSNIALKWMIDKAKNTGLMFNQSYIDSLQCDSRGELRKSLSGIYLIMGRLVRKINDDIKQQKKLSKGEQISLGVSRNEKIHYSCLERSFHVKKYKPLNVAPAYHRGTSFDPLQDTWSPEWMAYLEEYRKGLIAEAEKKRPKRAGNTTEKNDIA